MAEVRPIKRRKVDKDTTIKEFKKENTENEVLEDYNELLINNGTNVGYTKQKYAQMLSYSQLTEVLTQNVSKTPNRSFTTYTKERLMNYISNPLSNIDNIREVSRYLYRISMNYKKIVDYYALMPLFHYNITYKIEDWATDRKSVV